MALCEPGEAHAQHGCRPCCLIVWLRCEGSMHGQGAWAGLRALAA